MPQTVTASPTKPADFLQDVVISMLLPFFLPHTGLDIAAARVAAMQAMQGYRVADFGGLLTVLQMLTHGFASAVCLGMAMDPSLSPALRSRLFAQAAALERAYTRAVKRHDENLRRPPAPMGTAMEAPMEAPTETPTETRAETPREIGRASPTHSAADTVAEQPRTDRRQAKPAGTPQPRPQVAPAKKAGTAATTLPPAATQATAHPRPAPAQRTVSRPSLPYGVSEEDRAIWARAIEDAAKKFLSDPSEPGDTVRARALNSVARGLLTGAPDPASFRFQLPRTS